jgi:hypothetical protein
LASQKYEPLASDVAGDQLPSWPEPRPLAEYPLATGSAGSEQSLATQILNLTLPVSPASGSENVAESVGMPLVVAPATGATSAGTSGSVEIATLRTTRPTPSYAYSVATRVSPPEPLTYPAVWSR